MLLKQIVTVRGDGDAVQAEGKEGDGDGDRSKRRRREVGDDDGRASQLAGAETGRWVLRREGEGMVRMILSGAHFFYSQRNQQ